jgi:plastocyanin
MALGLAGTVAMGAAGTMEATPARNAARTSSQGAEHRPPGGRIEGTVTISEKIVARRPAFRIYADAGPGSQPPPAPRPDSIAELQNVVIYLDGEVSGDAVTARTGRATMTQHDERFSPHVLPIVRGDTVDFPNQDPYFHNVFSLSRAPREFDLGRYPKGESKFEAFTKTGIVEVFCHIHSNMSGIILVLGNRFFSVPTSNGRFALDGVPAGDYTVVGWHERINPVQHRVHVTEGGVAKVDFNIPLTSGG